MDVGKRTVVEDTASLARYRARVGVDGSWRGSRRRRGRDVDVPRTGRGDAASATWISMEASFVSGTRPRVTRRRSAPTTRSRCSSRRGRLARRTPRSRPSPSGSRPPCWRPRAAWRCSVSARRPAGWTARRRRCTASPRRSRAGTAVIRRPTTSGKQTSRKHSRSFANSSRTERARARRRRNTTGRVDAAATTRRFRGDGPRRRRGYDVVAATSIVAGTPTPRRP